MRVPGSAPLCVRLGRRAGFEESHRVFREAMPNGFAWEVTEVYSGCAPCTGPGRVVLAACCAASSATKGSLPHPPRLRTNALPAHPARRCALHHDWALVCRPPIVTFKWRHWGVMQGPLRCPLGHGQELSASATGQKIQARARSAQPLAKPRGVLCDVGWHGARSVVSSAQVRLTAVLECGVTLSRACRCMAWPSLCWTRT